MKVLKSINCTMGITALLLSASIQAETWKPIDDPKVLKSLFSDTVIEATLKEGVKATAIYKSDGTGVVKAWGDTFQRTWEIKGKDQVCIGMEDKTYCYQL